MEFGSDDGQLQMQQTVARVCADRFPLRSIGRRAGMPSRREMATLGMLGLLTGDTGGGWGVRSSPDALGVSIGSFQAVKHLLADMHVRSALAQSATYAAAAMVQDPADDRTVANARAVVHILGKMGFTSDRLPNSLLECAWVLDQGFGEADQHALLIGSTLLAAHQGATSR